MVDGRCALGERARGAKMATMDGWMEEWRNFRPVGGRDYRPRARANESSGKGREGQATGEGWMVNRWGRCPASLFSLFDSGWVFFPFLGTVVGILGVA